MYKIIGADRKEYGPVSGEQIRRWITEGRVNGLTQARLEGETEWQTFAQYADFNDLLAPPPGAPPPIPAYGAPATQDQKEPARQRVKGPAIGLIVTASINLLIAVWQLIKVTSNPAALKQSLMEMQKWFPGQPDVQRFFERVADSATGTFGITSDVLQLLVSAFILYGAIRMLKLQSPTLSFVASVLAVIPCITPCCGIITLPFGIWALVVLAKPEVKSQFG